MNGTLAGPDAAAAPLHDSSSTALTASRVQYLVEQVAVPVDAVVQIGIRARHGIAVGIDDLVARQSNHARRDRTALTAGDSVVEVASQRTTVVAAVALAIIHLTRRSIPVAIALRAFLTGELLQTPAVGIQVATVLGIAMTEPGGRETVARIVENHGAEHYLVATVHIHIGNGEVVEAVAEPGRLRVVAVPAPELSELVGLRIHLQCTHLVARVAATAQEDGWRAAIQIGCAEIVLARTVTRVLLAPDGGILSRSLIINVSGLALLESGQRIEHRSPLVGAVPAQIGLARLAVQVEQILLAMMGVFLTGAARAAIVVGHVAHVDGLARSRVNDHVVGTAHQHLGLAVHVPVIAYHIPLLVGTGHHVRPEVNPPEALTRSLVALIEVEVGLVGSLAQIALRIVALHDELHHAVARHIGQRDIIDDIARGGRSAIRDRVADDLAHTVHHRLHRHVKIGIGPRPDGCRLALRHAAHHRLHLIGSRAAGIGIAEVRHRQVLGHLRSVAIKVILRVVILFAKHAPRHDVGSGIGYGHNATVQFVGHALCLSTACRQKGCHS